MDTPSDDGVRPEFAAMAAEAASQVKPAVLVVMGVSGSGKTTVARELHRLLGWPYQEGDELHPAANVEKMRSGQPLNDQDRAPWLAAVARWIDERLAKGEPGIITCSNLRRAYRAITVGGRKGVILVYLRGDESLIADRVEHRAHQYMPPSLLRSQFDTLEEPGADEHAVTVTMQGAVAGTVTELLRGVAVALGGGVQPGVTARTATHDFVNNALRNGLTARLSAFDSARRRIDRGKQWPRHSGRRSATRSIARSTSAS